MYHFAYIFFSKPLENLCQVWYNITCRRSAQKLIDNKHPPIIGKIAGCIEREKIRQKVHKNLLIINAAALLVFPVSSLSLSKIRQKVGGVVGVRIAPIEMCETRQSFAHFNRSIRGEGGEVTFCFSLLLPAFPFPRRSGFFIFLMLSGREDCVNCGKLVRVFHSLHS